MVSLSLSGFRFCEHLTRGVNIPHSHLHKTLNSHIYMHINCIYWGVCVCVLHKGWWKSLVYHSLLPQLLLTLLLLLLVMLLLFLHTNHNSTGYNSIKCIKKTKKKWNFNSVFRFCTAYQFKCFVLCFVCTWICVGCNSFCLLVFIVILPCRSV